MGGWCSDRIVAHDFGRRCISSGYVAPRSQIPKLLPRRALPAERIDARTHKLRYDHYTGAVIAQQLMTSAAAASRLGRR